MEPVATLQESVFLQPPQLILLLTVLVRNRKKLLDYSYYLWEDPHQDFSLIFSLLLFKTKRVGFLSISKLNHCTLYTHIAIFFELNENDYSTLENDGLITATVNKNVFLANSVTLLLTPYSISEAIESKQPLPDDIPPESKLTNNYARCKEIHTTLK